MPEGSPGLGRCADQAGKAVEFCRRASAFRLQMLRSPDPEPGAESGLPLRARASEQAFSMLVAPNFLRYLSQVCLGLDSPNGGARCLLSRCP